MRTWLSCRLIMPVVTLALSGSAAFGQPPDNVRLPAKDRFHIFLLAGQSNMAGRGAVEEQDRQRPMLGTTRRQAESSETGLLLGGRPDRQQKPLHNVVQFDSVCPDLTHRKG